MELILSQDVPKLGKLGDLVKVKSGYARNFLLPEKLAYIATPENLKRIELQEKKKKAQREEEKKKAEALAEQLSKASCSIDVETNDIGRLYGSITDSDIVKALATEGFTIDRKDIIIESPIEEPGIFDISVKLHPEVTTKVRLWVTKK